MNPFSALFRNPFSRPAPTGSYTGKQVAQAIADPKVDLIKGIDNPFNNSKPKAAGGGQQPQKAATSPQSPDETPFSSNSYGSSGGSGSSADLAYLDTQESLLRDMLGRSGTALNQGLGNLNDSYNREVGSANQQRSRALEDFGMRREDTTRAKDDALGQVDTNARVLNDSLRRILGLAAGAGSSAYQYAAPNAVARQASGERNDVLSGYAENDRNLSLAENRAKEDFGSLLDDLFRQRQGKEQELRSGVLENEQLIQKDLADVAGRRAALQGGDVRAAQAPYVSGVNERQAQIDRLFDQFRSPMLSARPVNVQTPNLRDYLVDRAGINAQQQAGSDETRYSPYSYFLKRDQQDQMA